MDTPEACYDWLKVTHPEFYEELQDRKRHTKEERAAQIAALEAEKQQEADVTAAMEAEVTGNSATAGAADNMDEDELAMLAAMEEEVRLNENTTSVQCESENIHGESATPAKEGGDTPEGANEEGGATASTKEKKEKKKKKRKTRRGGANNRRQTGIIAESEVRLTRTKCNPIPTLISCDVHIRLS